MRRPKSPWLFFALMAVAIAGAIWLAGWLRGRSLDQPGNMVAYLPAEDAVLLFIDFAALRSGGLLDLIAGSKVAEEPEYKSFVAATGFDYSRDLNAAALSFHPTGTFLLARGRFDWKRLEDYVAGQQGTCYNTLCRMGGSTPDRKISFFPLRRNLMAMAVSTDSWAASRLKDPAMGSTPAPVVQPVWLSVPASVLRKSDSFPAGTRMFATSMETAENITLSLEPRDNRFRANLEVRCRGEREAAALAAQLEKITTLLREMIKREKQTPNPGDLSGVLTSGLFRAEGRLVRGYWPIEKSFVQQTLRGSP